MTIYLLYMASPIIVYLAMIIIFKKSINEDIKVKNKYLIICGIIMMLMIGLRNPCVGSSDTNFYYKNWEIMSKVPLSSLYNYIKNVDLEIGYQLSIWFFSHFAPNGQWLLVLSGSFFAITVCVFVKNNCKNVVLALLVFNCLGLFNFMVQGLRQSIAMCICLWALEQCKKDNLVRFIILIILAWSFHASATVFGIVYIISKFKVNVKSIILFFICAFFGVQLLPYLFDIVNILINDNYSIGMSAESGGVIAILIYIIIIIFGLIFRDNKNDNYPLFIYMAALGTVLMIMRNTVNDITSRMALYFAFSQIVILPNSINAINEKEMQIFVNSIVSILCFCVAVYKASYSILIPYTFFWQN